ncbi:MAG: chemotaxis protein CheB [Bdellovibrionales bacterium]|nr:chemotaxis protein CheB [Bdellovibrionales bacterium]
MENNKVRLLFVEDSSLMRTMLSAVLSADPLIEIVGFALDTASALDMITRTDPDLVAIDLDMTRLDTLTFLQTLLRKRPQRTLVMASLSARNSALALHALELGALDVIDKPSLQIPHASTEAAKELCARFRSAAHAQLVPPRPAPLPRDSWSMGRAMDHQFVALVASLGGTEALKDLVARLPVDMPATVIAQRLPPGFTRLFADSLQRCTALEVKEAADGDLLAPGKILVLPTHARVEVYREGSELLLRLTREVCGPRADSLLRTLGAHAGNHAVGVLLTGTGPDGAAGLLALKNAGGYALAQSPESCAADETIRTAQDLGAVDKCLGMGDLAGEITRHLQRRSAA